MMVKLMLSSYIEQQKHLLQTASKRSKNVVYGGIFLSICGLCLVATLTVLSVLLLQQEGYTLIASVSITSLALIALMVGGIIYTKHQSQTVKNTFTKRTAVAEPTMSTKAAPVTHQEQDFVSALKHDAFMTAESALAAFVDGFLNEKDDELPYDDEFRADDTSESEDYQSLQLVKNERR